MLLLKILALLSIIRTALAALPFKLVRRTLSRLACLKRRNGSGLRQSDIERIIRFTVAAGRKLPAMGTCLTQALTVHMLLKRRGYETQLRIGVTKDAGGRFTAHAWLERGGRILIGELGGEHDRYTPFPALNGLDP